MFILFFNNFKDCLSNANAIMYADDTVVYYTDDDIHSIEKCLTAEVWEHFAVSGKMWTCHQSEKGQDRVNAFGNGKKVIKGFTAVRDLLPRDINPPV